MNKSENGTRDSFLFYLGEVKGKAFRWFNVTMRFRAKPTLTQQRKIKKLKPRSLRKFPIRFAGRMARVDVGKILSRLKEDRDQMLRCFKRNQKKYIVPFDFTFYLEGFKGRPVFESELKGWLNSIHQICEFQFVIRDESDLGKYRYPGGNWSLVSDSFIAKHEESVPRAETLFDEISNESDVYLQTNSERAMFAFGLKFIDRVSRLDLFAERPGLSEFVGSDKYVESKLLTGEVDQIMVLARDNAAGLDIDPFLWIDLGSLISSDLHDPNPTAKIEPDVIFSLMMEMYPFKNAWEIAFGDAYYLSLATRLAANHGRDDVLDLVARFINEFRLRQVSYVTWIGYKAFEFTQGKKYEQAIKLYRIILPIDLASDDASESDAIHVYHQALWVITKRNSGLEVDDETIDLFLNRCLRMARDCAAVYANAAQIEIDRGNYKAALRHYTSMFKARVPEWPKKKVKLDKSVYCNALWVLLFGNTGIKVSQKKVDFFLEKCLPHAQENAAVYTNATYVLAQQKDLVRAREHFELSKKLDHENFSLLAREISELPALAELKEFLNDSLRECLYHESNR